MSANTCPECGDVMDRVTNPGDAAASEWAGPVKIEPCGCVVLPVWRWDGVTP